MQDNTHHSLCYISCRRQAGTKSSMGLSHVIDPITHCTMSVHYQSWMLVNALRKEGNVYLRLYGYLSGLLHMSNGL